MTFVIEDVDKNRCFGFVFDMGFSQVSIEVVALLWSYKFTRECIVVYALTSTEPTWLQLWKMATEDENKSQCDNVFAAGYDQPNSQIVASPRGRHTTEEAASPEDHITCNSCRMEALRKADLLKTKRIRGTRTDSSGIMQHPIPSAHHRKLIPSWQAGFASGKLLSHCITFLKAAFLPSQTAEEGTFIYSRFLTLVICAVLTANSSDLQSHPCVSTSSANLPCFWQDLVRVKKKAQHQAKAFVRC